MQEHDYYMTLALSLAREAMASGEVPVGAVVVDSNGAVVGRGRNRREELNSVAAHAEMEAIEEACNVLGDWRLADCSLYVTLEPCPMCAGAIIMSRISKLFYGTSDKITGSCGSVINLFMENYGQSTQVVGGILDNDCSSILTEFFKNLRR